jgi:hypothetical protein
MPCCSLHSYTCSPPQKPGSQNPRGRILLAYFFIVLTVFQFKTTYTIDFIITTVKRAKLSSPVQTGPGDHPASCTMGTGSFPGVKYGRGVTLTTHPILVPWSWKSRAIPLHTLWATPGLYRGYFALLLNEMGSH